MTNLPLIAYSPVIWKSDCFDWHRPVHNPPYESSTHVVRLRPNIFLFPKLLQVLHNLILSDTHLNKYTSLVGQPMTQSICLLPLYSSLKELDLCDSLQPGSAPTSFLRFKACLLTGNVKAAVAAIGKLAQSHELDAVMLEVCVLIIPDTSIRQHKPWKIIIGAGTDKSRDAL